MFVCKMNSLFGHAVKQQQQQQQQQQQTQKQKLRNRLLNKNKHSTFCRKFSRHQLFRVLRDLTKIDKSRQKLSAANYRPRN